MPDWTITAPRKLTLDRVGQVKALLMGGSIRIVGTDSTPPRLEISAIDRSPLTIRHHDNGTLELTHGPVNAQRILAGKLSRRRKYHATISLTVPRDCAVELSGAMAGLTVSGITAAVKTFTGQCSQILANLSGPVEVTNFAGEVEAMSVSGPLKVESSSADIVIADATGSVRAETGSGTLTLDARPRPGNHLQLATVNGPVFAGLPALTDIKVHLESEFGAVSAQFPEVQPISRDRITIATDTFGSPLSQLWVKTVSGDIALLRRTSQDQ